MATKRARKEHIRGKKLKSVYDISGNTVEENPLFPLPPDYETLTEDGQMEARLSAVSDHSTPTRFTYAWSFFRRYYLMNPGEGFIFFKSYAPSPPFHYQAVYDLAAYQYNLLAAPRGSSKSTIIGCEVPLLCLCTRKENFDISLCLAVEDMLAPRFDQIQMQIASNEAILQDFGSLVPKRTEGIWNKQTMRLLNGNKMSGLSVTGRKRGARPDLFLLDDPEFDPRNEHSQDALIAQFENVLFQQVIPMMMEGSGIFWIGTILNRRSFLYRAFSGEDPRFEHWNRVLYAAGKYNEESGHFTDLLWPEVMSDAFLLQRKKEMSPALFSAEYLNAPVSKTDRLLKFDSELGTYELDGVTAENLRIYNPFDLSENITIRYKMKEAIQDQEEAKTRLPGVVPVKESYPHFLSKLYRITLVDYAYTVNTTSDYSDVMTIGIDPQGTVWVLDNFLGRIDPAGINSLIMAQATRWQSHMICPESVSIQYALVDSLNILLRDPSINPGDITTRVVGLRYPNGLSKAERIAGLQKFFNNNRIKIPFNACHRERWEWSELTHQINDFTLSLELLAHDDAIDTLSMFQYTPYNWGMTVVDEPTILGPLERLAAGHLYDRTVLGNIPIISGYNIQDIPEEILMQALMARHKAKEKGRTPTYTPPRTVVDGMRTRRMTKTKRQRLLGKSKSWGHRAHDPLS